MEAIRVSATDLDAYRRFRDDEDSDIVALIQQLRRLMPSTDAMEAGSAFHSALEAIGEGEYEGLRHEDYTFSFEIDAEIDLPVIREMKATKDYAVSGVVVTVVGKVDAIHGKRVDDHKFTAKFDADRYMGSYQWRIYLDVFGADEFRWNIFEAIESAPKNYLIRNVHKLTMHRYPDMDRDIARELAGFVDFARTFLPERFNLAA